MTIDHQTFQQSYDSNLSSNGVVSFSNPFPPPPTSSQSQSQHMYAPQHNIHPGLDQKPRMNSGVSPYANVPITTAPAGSSLSTDSYGSGEILTMGQDVLSPNRPQFHDQFHTSAPSPVHPTYPSAQAPYDNMGYVSAQPRPMYAMQHQQQVAPQQHQLHQDSRRLSQPGQAYESRNFNDLDAASRMMAMSQTTPRANIYGGNGRVGRGSADSYGFGHSSNSSISSAGPYPSPQYYGSVDSSMSEYSNAGSDMDSVSSRTLPRPNGLANGYTNSGIPPPPQSMMGQFSSKVSSSTQKKHKCKVCDKRFTRPSSLQTHMYSHTGEKPFSCEVEGCGRHFSVVSNLRRHRKVHKGESARSEAGSDEHHSIEEV